MHRCRHFMQKRHPLVRPNAELAVLKPSCSCSTRVTCCSCSPLSHVEAWRYCCCCGVAAPCPLQGITDLTHSATHSCSLLSTMVQCTNLGVKGWPSCPSCLLAGWLAWVGGTCMSLQGALTDDRGVALHLFR